MGMMNRSKNVRRMDHGRRMVGDRLLPSPSTLNRRVFTISSVRRRRAPTRGLPLCAQTRYFAFRFRCIYEVEYWVYLCYVPYLYLIAFSSSSSSCDTQRTFRFTFSFLFLFLLRSNWPFYSVSGGQELRDEKFFFFFFFFPFFSHRFLSLVFWSRWFAW